MPNVHLPSNLYWETHYRNGGSSGAGSYGKLAAFKAGVINAFVERENIQSIVEFGCGDGHQLSLANYPSYRGFDISEAAIERCKTRFGHDTTKTFQLLLTSDRPPATPTSELALSLDVIYHLMEDGIYERHMGHVFQSATRFVILYTTNEAGPLYPEWCIRDRDISQWIATHAAQWKLLSHVPNPRRYEEREMSKADFWIYHRLPASRIALDEESR